MTAMKKILFIALLIVIAWKLTSGPGEVTLGPGVMAKEAPVQRDAVSLQKFQLDDYEIIPAARFDIKAKVLGSKSYTFGREADLSPVDLALGWGPMSDESILQKITISQSNRFYRWHVEEFPIPRREIETNSANMHMIPANKTIASKIKAARHGDIITLSGHLVNVKARDGWLWKSSLTRQDTGGGACELIWVEQFDVVAL